MDRTIVTTRLRREAILVAATIAALAMLGCAGGDGSAVPVAGSAVAAGPRTVVLETGPMKIDRIFPSMEGPFDRVPIDVRDLDWVTAFSTEVVDEAGEKLGDEYFCHAQLQLKNTNRLMVTATGIEEIRFPAGYAMPVSQIVGLLDPRQQEVTLLGMVLNNHQPDVDYTARVRWTIEYWRNEEIGSPPRLKRLYKVGLPMTVEDLAAYEPDIPDDAADDVATHCVLVEGLRTHWLVPPGRQVTRKRYENFMPVDARVHYGVVHLHNEGVAMSLTDVTTGEVLWRTEPVYEPDRRQIERIPVYSSEEGFLIRRDHVYEIEAVYDNIGNHDVDAMATMDLYYHPLNDEIISYPEGPFEKRPAHL